MRYLIIGAACACSILVMTIGAAYRPPITDHTLLAQPTAMTSTPAESATPPAIVHQPRSELSETGATSVPATPQPGTWCGEIDPGLWKRSPPAATSLLDGTALPAPQVLSDTMLLPPPGGTVPMPNACLPQQTPQPSSVPAVRNVVESVSP